MSATSASRQLGSALASSWRQSPPRLHFSRAQLTSLVSLLRESGAEGLVWRRLRGATGGLSWPMRQLRDAYRQQVLATADHEEHLRALATVLCRAGIEAVLVKGWSIARLYPEIGMRPCGDIDLCVAPERLTDVVAALTTAAGAARDVDLHAGLADLEDHGWAEVCRRARLAPLEGTDIRILGAEDQLRHLCLHLMRHGGFRPLWLCDVAVALEALPPDFDWDYCLWGQRWLTDWVICTIGLARRLLEARIDNAEIARRAEAVPGWLESTVLHLWGEGARSSDQFTLAWSAYPGTWSDLRHGLRQRWPNPIRAAYQLRLSPFTRLPRRLVQLAAFFARAAYYTVSKGQHKDTARPARAFDVHPGQEHVW